MKQAIIVFTVLIFALACGAAESDPLRHDAEQMVMIMDGPRDQSCAERKIVKTEVVESATDGAPAIERWTLDRCGKLVYYRVRFVPNSKGGTDFEVRREK